MYDAKRKQEVANGRFLENPTAEAEHNTPGGSVKSPEGLLHLVNRSGAEFFVDDLGIPQAWVPVDKPTSHRECRPVDSQWFQAWLYALCTRSTSEQFPRKKVVREALHMLKAGAVQDRQNTLSTRFAADGASIYIDLADASWRSVEVSKSGWHVCQPPRALFRRRKHQLPLPVPERGGDIGQLFDLLSLPEESHRLLVLSWMISAMNPKVSTPVLVFTGPQGAGKTSVASLIRSFLDPSRVGQLGEIGLRDLIQVFQYHAVPSFDNVSRLKRAEADCFCRAVTGAGIERRRLYTDQDEVLFSFRRAIIMNGIALPTNRPDFLDRCLLLRLHQRSSHFQPWEDLRVRSNEARSCLFGALLDLFVTTLRLVDSMSAGSEFRLADFARFGRAVAVALGNNSDEFDAAYRAARREPESEILEDSPVAEALRIFGRQQAARNSWTGGVRDLLKALKATADSAGIDTSKARWPGSPRWLSERLVELAPLLRREGIIVEQLPRQANTRPWRVRMADNDY